MLEGKYCRRGSRQELIGSCKSCIMEIKEKIILFKVWAPFVAKNVSYKI